MLILKTLSIYIALACLPLQNTNWIKIKHVGNTDKSIETIFISCSPLDLSNEKGESFNYVVRDTIFDKIKSEILLFENDEELVDLPFGLFQVTIGDTASGPNKKFYLKQSQSLKMFLAIEQLLDSHADPGSGAFKDRLIPIVNQLKTVVHGK